MLRCPGCTEPLPADGPCPRCRGIWLTHAQIQAEVGELERTGGTFSDRRCPVCSTRMQQPLMFGVPLDHCLQHGFWFDAGELDEVIASSKSDAWRLYAHGQGTGPQANAWNPVEALIGVIRTWRRRGG